MDADTLIFTCGHKQKIFIHKNTYSNIPQHRHTHKHMWTETQKAHTQTHIPTHNTTLAHT